MQIQTTALTTLVGTLIMFTASIAIARRVHGANAPALRPVRLFGRFFAVFGVFFLLMWLPNVLLSTNPAAFPEAMAWGYVVGHIFLYIAFLTAALMLCAIVPRLAGKERWVVVIGSIFMVYQTVINAITMIWGRQPSYNYEQSLVQYNAAPIVGAGIGVIALITIFPAGILFIMNAVRNPAQRLRSGLMGSGFLAMTIGGPMHDVATGWQMYAVADVVTIIGMLLTGLGVLYRLDQAIVIGRSAAVPAGPVLAGAAVAQPIASVTTQPEPASAPEPGPTAGQSS